MATYAYLLDPNKQYITKSGTINVAGSLRVYDAATDDAVITYKDFNGTENEESIILDNNGRAVVIADSARAYRLEVYDRYGSLQWNVSPLWCLAAGGGVAIHNTEIVSTDGSIDVDKITVGSTTTFDIGLAPNDSDEFLEWVKCSDTAISNGTLYPTYEDGSMETYAGQGLHVGKDKFYHITCTIKVDPTGAGINYETLSANLKFNDGTDIDLVRRNYDIDNSVNDPALCEFSYDFKAPADGYLYLYIEGVNTFEQVDCELQVHRIYSGINAVPDTCATKQWVQETFDYNMAEKISYSALGYNADNEITGISGSALAGGMDSATVSAIASSYAESAASGKLDQSSSGMFAPSGDYYSATNPSGFITTADLTDFAKESALSSKLDASASSMFAPSGDYVFESAYSAYTSDVANDISSISSVVSGITGDWSGKADQSAVDLKLDASASSQFYLTSNPSGFITGVDLSPYQLTADMSAYQLSGDYAYNSSLSAKLDASASSDFYSTSNPSGFITGVDLDPYVPFSSIEGTAGEITGIAGSAISVPDTFTGVHTDSSLTGNGLSSAPLGVERVDVVFDSSMTTAMSGDSIVIGVNESALDLTAYQYASAMTAYQTTAGMSGYIPTSESANYYSTANPSGFLTGVDLTPYQLTADMSGYQVSGDYAYNSSLSAKLDASASSEFQPSGDYYSATNPSGFVGSAYVDSSVSGKLDASASADFMLTSERADYLPASASADLFTGVETDSSLTGNGLSTSPLGVERVDVQFVSGLATGMSGDMIVVSADNDYYSGYATTAYVDSSVSGKLDASASSDFYSTANPSAFIDAASASAIASAYQVVSATATQLNAGTAYLTSVNETPISAARAGNAANAALATSAWYDGTGRTISALPDEATVSSIASAYAESAMSSKLDESATADFYSTSNPSGFITGVDLSDYATTAYVDSSISGFVDSAYVESQVSGKQDTLTFDWDADSAISSINGSALAGGGGGGGSPIVVTGTAWDPDTSAYVYDLSSNLSAAERHVYSSQLDGQMNYIDKFFDDSSNTYRLEAALIRAGAEQYAPGFSSRFVYMPRSSMWTTADAATGLFAPLQYATGACLAMSSQKNFKAYYKGNEWFVADDRYGYARGEVHQSRGCRVIVEHTGGAGAVLSAKNKEANVTLNNTAYCTAKMAVATNQAYAQVQRGNVDYKYNSAKLDTDYLKFYNGMATGYLDPDDTASGTAYLPAETEYMYISSIPYWNAKVDQSAYDNLYSAFTALNDLISQYSAYFSSISAKVDNSAIGVIE